MSVFLLDSSLLDSADVLPGGTLAVPGRDILVELDAYSGGTVSTFYFGSRAYNNVTAPDYYAPRLLQPLNFRRDIYAAATTGGAGRSSYGEMRLANNGGGLDSLRDYAIVGRPVRMLIGNVAQAYDLFEPLISGVVSRILFSVDEVTIQLRDRLQDFAQPVQANKYTGTNVLPDGLEGEEDLKDQPKPLIFGRPQNFTPVCVNTSKLIWQVNDGPIQLLQAVRDKGVALTAGADYTDVADMMATAPAAGTYRAWLDGGYFRLGAEPAGTITCDAGDYSANADNTAALVALRIASRPPETGEGGITSDIVNAVDAAALDVANSSRVGIYISQGESYASSLDAVLGSVGAWYGFDRLGIFRLIRLELPVAPAAITLRLASLSNPMAVGEYNIVAYRFTFSNDPEKGMPTWRVTVEYARNYTVQTGDALAGSVVQERKNFYSSPVLTAKSEDTTVQTSYPLAVEKTVSTLLVDPTPAEDEAARLLAIFSEPRDFLEVDVILSSDLITFVDIGSVVNIVIPRLGYIAGKLMRIIGMQYNAAQGIVTLVCWG